MGVDWLKHISGTNHRQTSDEKMEKGEGRVCVLENEPSISSSCMMAARWGFRKEKEKKKY